MFKNYSKLINFSYFLGGFTLLLGGEYLDNQQKIKEGERTDKIIKVNLKKSEIPFNKIFEAERWFLREHLKQYFHLSIPFNRKVKYIYNLDSFYYIDYENYNFNKLSDLFLNIHIFIN